MEFRQNDDCIVCDDCGKQFICGDCPDHGPLEWCDDNQLSNETPQSDQAKLTLPNHLNIMPSAAWQGQLGVFTKARIEKRVMFGPFRGQKIPAKEVALGEDHNFKYMWDILEGGKVSHIIDGSDEQNSNWMRFVNCARESKEQNLEVVQFCGEIYYKTCSHVESGTELLVWYGDSFSVKGDSLTQKDGHDYKCDICGLVFAGSTFLRRHKAVRCPDLSPDEVKTAHDQIAIEREPAQSSVIENTNNEDGTSPVDAESLYIVDIGTTINGTNSTVVEEGSRYVRVLQLDPASSSRTSKRRGLKQVKQAGTTKVATTRNPLAQKTRKAKENSGKSNVLEDRKKDSLDTKKARSTSSGKKSLSSERTSSRAKSTSASRLGGVEESREASSGSDNSQVQKNARNSKAKRDMSANCTRSHSDADEDIMVTEESSRNEINESAKKSKSQEAGKELNNSKSSSSRKRPSEVDGDSTGGAEKKRKRTALADKPIFTCEQCCRNFKWKSQLNYHMRSHSEIKEFVCSFCDKRLSQLSSLKRHLRVHSGEKPFRCEECGKRFVEKGKLTLHVRKHSGEPLEKKHKCSICDRGFTLSANLRTHMRTHTGEKPYPCPQCGKGFKRSSDIISHLRSHTGERPYKCSHCDKCFTMISHRNRHEVIHTGEKPFKCELCGKGFTQPNSVKAHLKVHERRLAKLSGQEMRQGKQEKNCQYGEIPTDVRSGTDDELYQGVLHSVASGQGTREERTEKLQGVITQITENEHLEVPIDIMHQKDSENAQVDQEPRPTVQPEDFSLSSDNLEGRVGEDVASTDTTELTTIAAEQLKLSYTGQDSTSEQLTFDNTLVNSKALMRISSAALSDGAEHRRLELAPASVQDQPQQNEGNETTLFAL